MYPDEQSSDRAEEPLTSQPVSPNTHSDNSRQAAAQVVRSQIDSLYENGNVNQSNSASSSPYDRTASPHPQPQAEQWKQYHSAWQNYYQKYYEGYYTQKVRQTSHTLEQQVAARTAEPRSQGYFSNQPNEPLATEEVMTQDDAVFDLRQKLLGKVKNSATKVRKSRHFVPITAALIVVLVFAFLQYNRVIVSNVMAYVSPGNIDPQNIVIDPNTDVIVGPDSKLIIPKINVDVPAIYGVGSDYDSQMAAMVNGVAHFSIPGASSVPGQIGNTVLSGHSSNDLLDQGDYKFIFAQLDKLQVGDTIYANYASKRYTYTVTKKEVVKPTDVNALVYATDKPILTLITCTPLGTSLNRLLVTAEQVSPDPDKSTPAPADTADAGKKVIIPGNSPTFLERIFGGGN